MTASLRPGGRGSATRGFALLAGTIAFVAVLASGIAGGEAPAVTIIRGGGIALATGIVAVVLGALVDTVIRDPAADREAKGAGASTGTSKAAPSPLPAGGRPSRTAGAEGVAASIRGGAGPPAAPAGLGPGPPIPPGPTAESLPPAAARPVREAAAAT